MAIDPTVIPSLIETCFKIYNYLQDVKESSEERRRLMREVLGFKGVLRELQDQLCDPAYTQNPSLMAHLERLLDPSGSFVPLMTNTLHNLEEKLPRGVDAHKTGLRATATKMKAAVLWSMDKDEVETLLGELERYKTLILLAMEQDVSSLEREMHKMISEMAGTLSNIATTTTNIKETVDTIGVAISEYDRRKVAEWISKIDFSAYHAENSRKWLPGTGDWVLKSPEFQTWESRKASSPTLWCYGDAGAGKSVIAAMIVEHLRAISGNVVLVIVCRYNQDRDYLRETYTFLCCLLRQLLQLERASNVPSTLLELYQKGIYPSNDILCTILIDAAHLIGNPIFIVLDALDECPLGFTLVATIQNLGHNFNLLITSRNVFSQIQQYPSLHIRAKDRDILALVDSKIPDLPWIQEDEALQNAVRSQVVAKANGMFLLASYTLWDLEHDVLSKVDVHRVLESIPVSLHDAYRQIFKRIDEQGDRRKKLALYAIRWIYMMTIHQNDVFRRNPLSWGMLRFLLACEISMLESELHREHIPSMDDIVNSCRGLLSVAEDDKEYPTFIHYSAQEYISRSEPSPIFDSQDPYELTFRTCTIALHHRSIHYNNWQISGLWLAYARFLDSCQPSTVQYALADKEFAKAVLVSKTNDGYVNFSSDNTFTPWIVDLILEGDSGLTALDYAAVFGLRRTFRLAQEAQAPNEHQLRRAMAIAIAEVRWDLVKEVWARGDFDINLFCDRTGSTTTCKLVSSCFSNDELKILRSFLFDSNTSLCCPRHDSLLGCALRRWDTVMSELYFYYTLLTMAMILERLFCDVNSKLYQPARFPIYPFPSSPRSHPPSILDVIAVFMQRADIDLDAHITQMVPPEILLALLMLPWQYVGIDKLLLVQRQPENILRPYARRRVDVPETSAPADAGTPSDHKVLKSAEAKDICALTAEPVPADSNLAHLPADEDRVDRETRRVVEAAHRFRMSVALLVLGAAIVFYLYVAPPVLVVQPSIQ